jgi:TrmH family RNA methyltransferase
VTESDADEPSGRTRRLLGDLEASACRVYRVPPEVVERLSEGRSGGGVVGLVRMPAAPTLADALGRRPVPPSTLLVACEVEDPGNVGALVRTALAAGAAGFAAVGIADPYHPKAVRTSLGSLFKLPILRYAAFEDLREDLRAEEVLSVGAVSSEGTALAGVRFGHGAVAIIVGSEAFGLPAGVTATLDRLVTIPMSSEVDSFSVNAAAAILLYEIRRQAEARGA